MKDLKGQLDEAIVKREFERAAGIRDQIKELEESSYQKEKVEPTYDDGDE